MSNPVSSFIAPSLIMLKILAVNYMFANKFNRRRLYWLRYIGYGFSAVVITFWTALVYAAVTQQGYQYGGAVNGFEESAFNFIFYLAIFFMAVAVTKISYKESFSRILLCCAGAYAAQHIAFNISSLLQLFNIASESEIYSMLLDFITFILVYALIYFLFARTLKVYETYEGNNVRKVVLSLIVIFTCIAMSRLTSDNPQRNLLSVVAEAVYAILSCSVLLITQFGLMENDSMHRTVDNITELLLAERRQYELSSENIKLINEKCHDLKYQISALRKNASEESISEIENAIIIYDSMVKTGHDVLDVILTEKKLQCERSRIHMTCMIKGELISFIENMDVYSLFGNAISNAIESASKVTDEQKRCIGINVKNVGNLLSIHIENYCGNNVVFEGGGLPLTTKDDKNLHGFGMASMRRIARKYGGEMTLSVENNVFNLDFLIPIK